jgi:hypothetical protein
VFRKPDASGGFVVVQRSPWWRLLPWVIAVLWPVSLLGVYGWASARAVPALAAAEASLRELREQFDAQAAALEQALQGEATARRSDQISRAANTELQATLAEREEEVAGLRADLAFYESLVGATGPRAPLRVHAARFQPEAAGSWRYTVTLTQNLNRAAITRGTLRFSVEGVREGRLVQLAWGDLVPAAQRAGQAFSFRYFQRLEGSIVLPAGFTPQRVKVSLSGPSGAVEQSLPWQADGES